MEYGIWIQRRGFCGFEASGEWSGSSECWNLKFATFDGGGINFHTFQIINSACRDGCDALIFCLEINFVVVAALLVVVVPMFVSGG